MTSHLVFGQDSAYVKGKEYVINDIVVTGIKSFNEQTVITYTGLFVGKKVQIPGEDISKIINKLWKLELFSDINFYITKIIDDKVDIEISIVELPSLSEYKITGLLDCLIVLLIIEILSCSSSFNLFSIFYKLF